MVATLNRVATEEQDLHRHLFGRDRLAPPKALRDGLAGLQAGCCFYCHRPSTGHRRPTISSPGSAAASMLWRTLCWPTANATATNATCCQRLRWSTPGRAATANTKAPWPASPPVCGWDSDPAGTLAVARSICRHLPTGLAPFWHGTGLVDITHARPGIIIEIT